MTAAGWVPAGLVVLAALDGAFAGFRSSCGRTGLIRRRREDIRAHLRGLATAAALLGPVAGLVLADVLARPERWDRYLAAGRVMLLLYLPFGAVVLAALAGYAVLGWRRRFLATALILGPCTFARPYVAAAGVVLAARAGGDLLVTLAAAASVAAACAVEPVLDRWWVATARRRPPDRPTGTASRR
ncbi:hypothetical protein GCM10020358_55290 [Amorphoplanes nipponensis]|uniref:Uncharacterized protein n=1 Tax=Actinoplanes nipponensis TaxID=135950 RepID=A0A919JNV0_9ACTN|nr:hypothetical protein [Actinoplanes nipponensis]GIE54208.1 hypothetical protein Ani05nite_77420 [Actinoplanes nipponensis]